MNYKAQTNFRTTPDNRMVYSLRGTGRYRKINGKMDELMENDVYVQIEARHLPPEVQKEIAECIAGCLNLVYGPTLNEEDQS